MGECRRLPHSGVCVHRESPSDVRGPLIVRDEAIAMIEAMPSDLTLPRTVDVVVIGAGVVGCSLAWHLSQFGAKQVLVIDQGRVGEGTSAMSSGILRTHYSVPENVELARRSWPFYQRMDEALGDEQATAGLVRCGYLIVAPSGPLAEALDASLHAQRDRGIAVEILQSSQARALLPIADFDHDAALIGYEPEAGYADAYLATTSFARAARRGGVRIAEGITVQGVLMAKGRVAGVRTNVGEVSAPVVISAQNMWSTQLAAWCGVQVPVRPERHRVLALSGPSPYTSAMPVFKDLASPGLYYARSYGGTQMLVSDGRAGDTLTQPDLTQGDVSLDHVAEVGAQVAARFPGWEEAGLASSWTGVYDVTPDWNPILGPVQALPGLLLACGFSGHGFKLAPAVGRVVAQAALGMTTDVSLLPYALERFAHGRLLTGRYGAGAVS